MHPQQRNGYPRIGRVKNWWTGPRSSAGAPGGRIYSENFYPEFLDNLSSCKSPQQMFGAIAKSYYAEKFEIDPKKIFVASVMPCVAKKGYRKR